MSKFGQVKERSTNQVRAGVTGHNVRYVLAFGLLGVIIAFAAIGFYYWSGSQPKAAPPDVGFAPTSTQPTPGSKF